MNVREPVVVSSMDWQDVIAALTNPTSRVEIGQDFIGYQHRPLGWQHQQWRNDKWFHFILVDQGEIHLGPHDPVIGPGDVFLRSPVLITPVHFKPEVRYWEIWFAWEGQKLDNLQPGFVHRQGQASLRVLIESLVPDLTRYPSQTGRLGLSFLLSKCLDEAVSDQQG